MTTEREERARVIGGIVRNLRRSKVMTQAGLAEESGMSLDAVNRIETGKNVPQRSSILKLADALGVEPGSLVPEGNASGENGSNVLGRLTGSSAAGETISQGHAREVAGAITFDEFLLGTRQLSGEKRAALSVLLFDTLSDTLSVEDDSYLDDEEYLDEGESASTYVVRNR